MTAFIESYPATLVPVDDHGNPTEGELVEVFQLRPGDQNRLTLWSGVAGYPGADGGVLLLDGDTVVGRVQLGEFVVRDTSGLRVKSDAAALFRAYQPLR